MTHRETEKERKRLTRRQTEEEREINIQRKREIEKAGIDENGNVGL